MTRQSLGFGQRAPVVDLLADLVDDRGRVVLLLFGREALALVEDEFCLVSGRFRFFGFGIGVMNSARRRFLDDLACGLAAVVQLPVPGRVLVGRVEDWAFEKAVESWSDGEPARSPVVQSEPLD